MSLPWAPCSLPPNARLLLTRLQDANAYECCTSNPPLKFRELIDGDSKVAGTIALDDVFFKLAKKKIAGRATQPMADDITRENIVALFKGTWERIKVTYRGIRGYGGIEVPRLFRTYDERRGPRKDPAPLMQFTL